MACASRPLIHTRTHKHTSFITHWMYSSFHCLEGAVLLCWSYDVSTDNTLPVQSDSKWALALSLLLFHLSSLTLTEQSSGIFSSELLRVDSLSRSSFISLKRSATHCAVSRASGSWSQHSLMVAQTKATPYRRLHLLLHFSTDTKPKLFYFSKHKWRPKSTVLLFLLDV